MSEYEPLSPELQDELTAYMDGELDPASVRRVEERLARDPAYEAELRRLERAWDLLDRLPRATVDESFTNTTIEMVAVAASHEVETAHDELPRSRRRLRLLSGLGALAAGLSGFAVGHWLWPDPNRQLLEDLPVVESFELYYQADNIDFLHLLDDQGLFADGESDHAS